MNSQTSEPPLLFRLGVPLNRALGYLLRGPLQKRFTPAYFKGKTFGQTTMPYLGKYVLNADLSSYIENRIFFRGLFRKDTTNYLKENVPTSGVALDIGANMGAYTFIMADRIGDRGQVHAFEPNPVMHGRLTANVSRNALKNVTVHKLALENFDGTAEFFLPSEGNANQGIGSLTSGKETGTVPVTVTVQRLDDFVAAQNISRIDFIKIDTEGHDCQVMLGGMESIRRFKPTILFEAPSLDEPENRSALDQLTQAGYTFQGLTEMGKATPISVDQFPQYNDIVAAPKH